MSVLMDKELREFIEKIEYARRWMTVNSSRNEDYPLAVRDMFDNTVQFNEGVLYRLAVNEHLKYLPFSMFDMIDILNEQIIRFRDEYDPTKEHYFEHTGGETVVYYAMSELAKLVSKHQKELWWFQKNNVGRAIVTYVAHKPILMKPRGA